MKLKFSFIFFAFALLTFLNSPALAQKDSTIVQFVRIELINGEEFLGNVIEENDSSVVMKTISELKITIPLTQIKSRELVERELHKGEYWFENPNRSRLFFAPTGRALKDGEGYFAAYEIFFPFVAIGITDYVTLAGGMSLIPGIDSQIFYFAPKLTPVSTENFDMSIGLLFLVSPGSGSRSIVYTVGTYGNDYASGTLGIGYGFEFNSDSGGESVLMFGGELRTSESFGLVSENWIFPSGGVFLFSFGGRFFGEKIAADFGLVTSSEAGGGFPFLPWLGFIYNF